MHEAVRKSYWILSKNEILSQTTMSPFLDRITVKDEKLFAALNSHFRTNCKLVMQIDLE